MSSSNALWHHQDVAIWIIVGALVLMIGLTLWRGRVTSNGAEESPETIVKRRYARGEIDEPTYEHMLEALRK